MRTSSRGRRLVDRLPPAASAEHVGSLEAEALGGQRYHSEQLSADAHQRGAKRNEAGVRLISLGLGHENGPLSEGSDEQRADGRRLDRVERLHEDRRIIEKDIVTAEGDPQGSQACVGRRPTRDERFHGDT